MNIQSRILELIMFKLIAHKWKNYRHRFLPWLAFNLKSRIVPESVQVNAEVEGRLLNKEIEDCLRQILDKLENPCKCVETALIIFGRDTICRRKLFKEYGRKNREILLKNFGFDLEIKTSAMPGAGKGVFLRQGRVIRGQVVALYPGTIYMPYQPILLPSIKNPYIFRCSDGIFIDGNYRGLSAMIYKSIHGRDRIGSQIPVCDISWLHLRSVMNENSAKNKDSMNDSLNFVINPLNVGQIVNNANPKIPGHSANLAYQEVNLIVGGTKNDPALEHKLLGLLPNAYYKNDIFDTWEPFTIKVVALVATVDINQGDELLATYFTLVNT